MSREAMERAISTIVKMRNGIGALGVPYGSRAFADSLETLDILRAALAAPEQQPVAEVTYSNWNGMNASMLADAPRLPVGTKLYAAPQPQQAGTVQVAYTLDDILDAYRRASLEVFNADVLNAYIRHYPEHRAALLRYAQVQLTYKQPTREEIEAETVQPCSFPERDETAPSAAAGRDGAGPPCTWTQDEPDNYWLTQCGKAWHFEVGGPAENEQHFCHHCGGKLIVAQSGEGNP